MTTVADRVVDTAYETGWRVVRRMPERSAYALFERIADATWARHGRQVRRLESNLRRVVGTDSTDTEVRNLSREGMRSYLRYWCDAFRLPGWGDRRILATFEMHNGHLLDEAVAAGRGAIVALPHMGNWDHAGAWAALTYPKVVTVVERLEPEKVFEQFLDFRRSLGLEALPLTGGSPPFPTLLRRLREGAVVPLISDRDLGRHGLPVQFFGAEARFPAGPAALAVQSGAPLLAAGLWHADGRNHARLQRIEIVGKGDKSVRIAETTQAVAVTFEAEISAHPADWHMLQRLWTADLDPSRALTS